MRKYINYLFIIVAIVLIFLFISATNPTKDTADIEKGTIVEIFTAKGEKLFDFIWGEDGLLNLYEQMEKHKKRKGNGVFVIKYQDKTGKTPIRLFTFVKGKPELIKETFKDPDITAPVIKITAGPLTNITTNKAFTITFSVNEDYGYVSTNNATSFTEFKMGEKSFDITETSIIKYYARDDSLNISKTNGLTVTFTSTANTGIDYSPVASFIITPTNGSTNTIFSLDASGSTDQNNDISNFSWDFNEDGIFEISNIVSNTYTTMFSNNGIKKIILKVEDSKNNKNIVTNILSVKSVGTFWNKINTSSIFLGRFTHQTLVFQNSLWVIGGNNNGQNKNTNVWYTTDLINWNQATTSYPQSHSYSHETVVFKNKIWAISGYNRINKIAYSSDGTNWLVKTNSYSSNNWRTVPLTVFNSNLIVVGGSDQYGNYTNDVWISTDGTNWEIINSNAAFPGHSSHEVVSFNNSLWLIGGNTISGRVNDIWVSSDATNWVLVTNSAPFSKRQSHQVVVFRNKLWLIGGSDSVFYNDIWSSDDGTNWILIMNPANFSARGAFGCVVYKNKLLLIGGTENNNDGLNDIWYTE